MSFEPSLENQIASEISQKGKLERYIATASDNSHHDDFDDDDET